MLCPVMSSSARPFLDQVKLKKTQTRFRLNHAPAVLECQLAKGQMRAISLNHVPLEFEGLLRSVT